MIAAMQERALHFRRPYVLLRPARSGRRKVIAGEAHEERAIVGGTDAPSRTSRWRALASVSRKLKDGTVFYPAQPVSRQEALKSYTLNNAYAAFEDKLKGSRSPASSRISLSLSKTS
jgi:predicted amidohydrolase YtcJ